MKVQIDENSYLTGSYCIIGSLDNSIEMENLPDSLPIYYPAYKIVSEQIEKKITVDEDVRKTREIQVPIYDEEGNETGEYNTIPEEYVVIEPVEKITYETVHHYEFDETRKTEIDDLIKKLPSDGGGAMPTTIAEVSDRVTNVQVALCEIYERLEKI